MKHLLVTTVSLLMSGLMLSADAGGNEEESAVLTAGPYLGFHIGAAIASGMGSTPLNTGPDVGAQLGYHLGNLRVEGAFTYYSNNLEGDRHASLHLVTVMGNAYYDFCFSMPFVPFVGAGIGWVHSWRSGGVKINGPESNEFAYQWVGGVNFSLSRRTLLGLAYRRLGWTDGNGNQNVVEASLNYLF